MPIPAQPHFCLPRRGHAGALPRNVTNFGAGAINPRKGDSSCYPRVMPEAYPWLTLVSPWLNPGLNSPLISPYLCNPFQGCVIVGASLSTGAPPALPAVTVVLPFQGKILKLVTLSGSAPAFQGQTL